MLKSLQIKNILIIDKLDLNFTSGLNVLTGETGAGKSILLDALRFVLGYRVSKNLLRVGTKKAEITVGFELKKDTQLSEILELAGFNSENELLIRRIISQDGRKQAFINDNRVTLEFLKSIAGYLIEFHGQHNDSGLLNEGNHCLYLDRFSDLDTTIIKGAWQEILMAKKKLSTIENGIKNFLIEKDFLEYSLSELVDLNVKVGEENVLAEKRRLMRSSGGIKEKIENVILNLNEGQIDDRIIGSMKILERVQVAENNDIENVLETLERCLTELGEALEVLEGFRQTLNFSQKDLEETEERLFSIRGLARKHQVDVDTLPALHDEFKLKLAELCNSEQMIGNVKKEITRLIEIYKKLSEDFSAKRREGAIKLNNKMAEELKPLNLDHTSFQVEVSTKESGPDGVDDICFTVLTNAGSTYGPLKQIASGGELSRFTLALKVCLSQQNSKSVMVFDEIDNGVGGKTADAIGRRLLAISKNEQIITITHSPQVAALADTHFIVEKSVFNNETFATVETADYKTQIEEIARMLSGSTLTEEARKMAEVLVRN
jgi:DNA repair protein RecN (Recombination protein N)